MTPSKPNSSVARKLYEAFLAGDFKSIYALRDPKMEWELVGPKGVTHFGLFQGMDEVKHFFSIIGSINRVESFEVLSCIETGNGAQVQCREGGHFESHAAHFDLRSCQLLEI